jgi:hypothetical protein
VSNFTVSDHSPNNYYVYAPYWKDRGDHDILEMQPRWLDPQTLQLAVSLKESRYTMAGHNGVVGLRRWCPGLAKALEWCAARRMGVKLVAEPCDVNMVRPEIIETVNRRDDWAWRAIVVPSVEKGYAQTISHRLVFKKPNHAFEFKMRWL